MTDDDLRSPPPSLFLALHKFGTEMIGFDARTGKQTWRESIGCSHTVYTPAQMVCLNVFGDQVRAAVVDPATGTRTADVEAPIPEAGRPQTWVFLTPRLVTSGQGVVMGFWFSTKTNVKPTTQYVYLNTMSGTSVHLQVADPVVTGDDERGELLIGATDNDVVTAVALHDPQGAARCTFPLDAAPATTESRVTAWLHDQIVSVVDHGDRDRPEQVLSTFDRDCHAHTSLPMPANTIISSIVPAAGATVVVRADDMGTFIDGYAPR